MKTLILALALCAAPAFATTAYPIPPAQIQFLDTTSGDALPCSGCTVSTFTAGTSTPVKTYSDSTATVQNPVSITLDSNGLTPSGIWLAGTCVKIELTTAASVVLYDIDNVCSAAGPSGATGAAGAAGATGATGAAGATGATGTVNYSAGTLLAADMNATTDQAITLTAPSGYTRYVIRYVTMSNCSISMTTAVGGVYLNTGKSGGALVAAAQVYSAITSNLNELDLTLTSLATNFWYGSPVAPVYFSLTTPQGSTAVCDISVIVTWLP